MPSRIARRPGPFRGLRLRFERARLATRIRNLKELAELPHDVADAARARIERLTRRERALERLLG